MKFTDEQIKYMVERFLAWKLPDDFHPDGGISFKRMFNENTDHPMKHEPLGTNLLDYSQAKEMVRYMTEGLPDEPAECPVTAQELRETVWKFVPAGPWEVKILALADWIERGANQPNFTDTTSYLDWIERGGAPKRRVTREQVEEALKPVTLAYRAATDAIMKLLEGRR